MSSLRIGRCAVVVFCVRGERGEEVALKVKFAKKR